MSKEEQDLSFLDTIKPLGVKEVELGEKDELSFLEGIKPLTAAAPEAGLEEEGPSFLEKIKGMGQEVLGLLPQKKEAPEVEHVYPEMPTIGPPTEKERYMAESGRATEILAAEQPRYPDVEELEYGRFEQLLDIPGQFLTKFAKMFAWGAPEFIPGEEPAPKTEIAEIAGALGHLGGLAGAGLGKAAAYAPFKIAGKIAGKIWKKPAKTLAGKVIQNMVKNANTLGLALGATEWEGGDAEEILRSKGEAFLSGEAIGAFFGGMQFVHFSKINPMLSYIFRYGTGAALLDLAEQRNPFDERTLFNKVFDYGLTAYFLKSGVSAKNYQKSATSLLKEIKRFNKEAKAEDLNVKLPESLEEITAIAGRPETWGRPGEPKRLVVPATYFATEKGAPFKPGTPEAEILRGEAEVLKAGYRAVEPKPIEPETKVNIRPKEDGSIDVTWIKPPAKVEAPGRVEAPVAAEKKSMMESIWGIFEQHPRVLWKDIMKYAKGNEEIATPREIAEYFESRGKEVLGKLAPPEVAKEAKPVTYKDELIQDIHDLVGKIKPNPDYSRAELMKILPLRMIGAKGDPAAKEMDIAAQALKHKYPGIEGNSELYDMLVARKKVPVRREVKEKERVEAEFEEHREKEVEELKKKTVDELRELREKAATGEEKVVFTRAINEKTADALVEIDQREMKKMEAEEKQPGLPMAVEEITVEEARQLGGRATAMEAGFEGKEKRLKPRPPISENLKEAYKRIAYKAPLEPEHKKALREAGIKQKEIEKLRRFPEELPEVEEKPIEEKVAKKKTPEMYRRAPGIKAIEKALKEGKELTAEQKEALKEKGMYEEKKIGKRAPLPEPEPEEMPERMNLVKVSITDPTGKVETFEIPEGRVRNLQDYAKETGVKIETGKSFRGRWGQVVPPAEEEKAIKNFMRAVKEEPKEKWESWEKEVDTEYQKLYSGLAPPEFVKTVAHKILSKLQIEPQFKAVGGPDTGLAVKRYHPIRNAEVERGEVWIKKLKKLKLSTEDYQELTMIAAKPSKFYPMSKEQRAKWSPAYRIISGKKGFFKEYEARLKELNVIEEGWPKSQLNRLREESAHIKTLLETTRKMKPERKAKLDTRLKDIYGAIDFIQKSHPQYVHIPRMWFELIWDRNPTTAPRIVTELFKQRKTLDIEKLAKYLTSTKVRNLIPKDEWDLYKGKDLDKPLLKPEDLDIRRIMFAYAHKVGHKIALAEIFRNAEKEGLLRDTDLAPQNWMQMPSRLYPTLKGKRAHPVLADFFETNFVRKGFLPPKLGGVLGTIKLLQFYNPLFLPMYDVVQAFWAGSVRSRKTPRSVWRAFSSMKNKDKEYWDMHHWGGFSTPFTPSFEMYMKRAEGIIKENSFIKDLVKLKYVNPYELYKLSWKAAWTGDHFIRMITYHHYLQKGLTPRESAQTAAKLHADYASIPPSTRKWMNKIFFTPSFKIAMMAAQADMVKNAGRALTKAGRAKMGPQDKAMAKALLGLAGGVAIREGVMHALGFKTDQFGLKYYKEIETDEGKKELVLHTATPDNVVARFYHRFKNILPIFGKEEQKLRKLVDRAKWEFHPLWQLSMEVYANKSVAFEPIYNKFDAPEKIMADVLGYSTKRLLRATELLPGISDSIKRRDAYNALVKDLDGFGVVLSGFTLPYIRSTRVRALAWEIKRLKREFKWMKEDDPAKSPEEADKRLKKFRGQLEKLRDRLEELREEKE